MDKVLKWHPDVVIGDAVAVQWAGSKNVEAHLIESSMETIVDAFERAMLVYKNLSQYILAEEKLATVLNCTREGAALINHDGRIEEINKQGCNTLSKPRDALLGANYSDYFDSSELNAAFAKNAGAHNLIVDYHDEKFALDHIAVSSESFANSSSVILFQPVQKISGCRQRHPQKARRERVLRQVQVRGHRACLSADAKDRRHRRALLPLGQQHHDRRRNRNGQRALRPVDPQRRAPRRWAVRCGELRRPARRTARE